MKKHISIIILILIGVTCKAQNLTIPDPNFKAYLLGEININTNQDNEIQLSEATNYNGGISCPHLNISDLSGIEAFTSITALFCYDNQLTSLDVSANTKITSLSFDDNLVSSIDLSNNTALIELGCGMNQLRSLDVSANTALESLVCRYNQIDSLDISANSDLAILISNNNQLIFLNAVNGNNSNFGYFDVFANPDLRCIYVDDATYSNSNWLSKDSGAMFYDDQTNCEALGLEYIYRNQNISIYPNPGNGVISVKGIEMNKIELITFTNLFGIIVMEVTDPDIIDISNLSDGFYIVQLDLNDGNKVIAKIAKE